MKLYMCKGLPASGKDTWAKEKVLASGGKLKRVNKDMMREMFDGGKWSKDREKQIVALRDRIIEHWLHADFDVICTDTNLAEKHEKSLRIIAEMYGADFEVVDHFLKVPIAECIDRDAKRGDKAVGKDVITRMYYDFIFTPPLACDKDHISTMISETPLSPCIIVDIDGTIAFRGKRSPYDLTKVKEDKFNYALWEVIKHFPYPIIFLSGREGTEQCKLDTFEWLKEHTGIDAPTLLMRKEGDNRKDYIVKRELLDTLINKYELEPIMAFDDRDQVVDMWRSLGIMTAQMNYGSF